MWRVPVPVVGSAHAYKYALAYVVGGECVLRYDNEAGKGDHRHVGALEVPYRFTTPDAVAGGFLVGCRSMEPLLNTVTLSVASRET